jgi:hypothetical protein
MAGGLADSIAVRVTVVVFVFYISIKLFQWGVEERKIQGLGGRAKRIPSYPPFGLTRLFCTRSANIDATQAWMSFYVLSIMLHVTATWISGHLGSVEPPTPLLLK